MNRQECYDKAKKEIATHTVHAVAAQGHGGEYIDAYVEATYYAISVFKKAFNIKEDDSYGKT